MTTGKCRHGTFVLNEGCPQCIAEKQSEKKVAIVGSSGEIVHLVKTIAEIQENPKPETALTIVNPNTDPVVMSFYSEGCKLLAYAEQREIITINVFYNRVSFTKIISHIL